MQLANNEERERTENEQWIQWPYRCWCGNASKWYLVEWRKSERERGTTAVAANQQMITTETYSSPYDVQLCVSLRLQWALCHEHYWLLDINKSALGLRMHNVQLFKYNYHSTKVHTFSGLPSASFRLLNYEIRMLSGVHFKYRSLIMMMRGR